MGHQTRIRAPSDEEDSDESRLQDIVLRRRLDELHPLMTLPHLHPLAVEDEEEPSEVTPTERIQEWVGDEDTPQEAMPPFGDTDMYGNSTRLAIRLRDRLSLAPVSTEYLPSNLSEYERAVCTGFPNFEWGNYDELIKQAYRALCTAWCHQGATHNGQKYEYAYKESGASTFWSIQVGDHNDPVHMYGYVEDHEDVRVALKQMLRVRLPGRGCYDYRLMGSSLRVNIFPDQGPAIFSYDSRDIDGPTGSIPEWQDHPDPSNTSQSTGMSSHSDTEQPTLVIALPTP